MVTKDKEVELNSKAKLFKEYLEEHKITAFSVENLEDDLKTTIFRSYIEVAGQRLETILVLDASIYGILRVNIGNRLVKESNKRAVLEHLNELNRGFKVFKYYATEDGSIILDSCILLNTNQPNGDMIYSVIRVVVEHLEAYYPALMAKVWSNGEATENTNLQ